MEQGTQKINEAIIPQLGRQLPWSDIKVLISKIKEAEQTYFYIKQTIKNGWSRDELSTQIKYKLHERQGKAISNFEESLPNANSTLIQETTKNPYILEKS